MNRDHFFILLLFILSCKSQDNGESIKPHLSDITESVYAFVTIKPYQIYYPQTTRSGVIKEIFIREGEIVEKGQVLFQISRQAEEQNSFSQAELNFKEAERNYLSRDNLMTTMLDEITMMARQVKLDSINFNRQERLKSQNIGATIDYDRAKLNFETSRNKLLILQKQLEQMRSKLDIAYKKAQTQLESERSKFGDLFIRSTIEGKVYNINKKSGESITTQEHVAEIGSHDQFKIEMDIDEIDITKVTTGDTVSISLDAYPDNVFLAITTKISPKKDETTQTFLIEGEFINYPPSLYYGLSGEANIIVSKRKDALVIPSDYLMDGQQVMTVSGPVPVKTGVKNMSFVEVLSGIDTSTLLIKPDLR